MLCSSACGWAKFHDYFLCADVSRLQAALAIVVQHQLGGLQGPSEVFDPVFTADDLMALGHFGLQVLVDDHYLWHIPDALSGQVQ